MVLRSLLPCPIVPLALSLSHLAKLLACSETDPLCVFWVSLRRCAVVSDMPRACRGFLVVCEFVLFVPSWVFPAATVSLWLTHDVSIGNNVSKIFANSSFRYAELTRNVLHRITLLIAFLGKGFALFLLFV